MDESIPVLPHLPGVEIWRESTQSAVLHRSPRLEALDDALATYEASFRCYSVAGQAYYPKLRSGYDAPGSCSGPQALAAREQAEATYGRALHDFEAVEIAFNTWLDSGNTSLGVPVVRQLDASLSTGQSHLDARSPQAAPALQGAERSTGTRTGPAKGLVRKRSLKPPR